MDTRVQALLDKAKALADKTGKAAIWAADAAGKKASEMAQSTRMNLQVFDLNTECDGLYKQIGQMVYDTHIGVDTDDDILDDLIMQVEENHARITELKTKLTESRGDVILVDTMCPQCGRICGKDDAYCAACGAQL